MQEKGVLKIEAIVTNGQYKVAIYDTGASSELSELNNRPLSITVRANPVLQNEER